MISQITLNQLRDMHLTSLAADIRERSESKGFTELTFDQQIEVLIDREWHRRKDNTACVHIREASFCYPSASALEIDYSEERGLEKRKINELVECGYLLHGRNIIIMGATGVGKTYLACALGTAACRNRYTCKYIRMPNLLDELALAREDGSFSKTIQRLSKVSLLILDEWLLNRMSSNNITDIFELFEYRYTMHKSTIFCTQIDVSEWMAALGNGLISESLLDRIIHNSESMLIAGDSMRKRLASVEN